ncbi:MAG: hypothetical protein EB060_11815 [Proteobacteria bacterium]|nr:hypothetical protein [Pseudomonadota bacterium]
MAFVWRKPTRTLLISWVISFACPTAFAQVIPACYIKNSKEVIERACSDFDREEGKLKSNKQLTAAKTSCKLFYGSLVLATEHYCDYQNNTVLAAEASKSSAEKEGADSKTSQERVAVTLPPVLEHGKLRLMS